MLTRIRKPTLPFCYHIIINTNMDATKSKKQKGGEWGGFTTWCLIIKDIFQLGKLSCIKY